MLLNVLVLSLSCSLFLFRVIFDVRVLYFLVHLVRIPIAKHVHTHRCWLATTQFDNNYHYFFSIILDAQCTHTPAHRKEKESKSNLLKHQTLGRKIKGESEITRWDKIWEFNGFLWVINFTAPFHMVSTTTFFLKTISFFLSLLIYAV